MRRWLLAWLCCCVTTTGCTILGRNDGNFVAPPLKVASSRPAIQPGDVTRANAHVQARALNEELDSDIDGEFE